MIFPPGVNLMYVRRRTCCTDDCIKLVWTFMLIHDWEVISCDLFRFIFNPSFESKRKLISWKNINLRFYRRTPFLRFLNKYYKNFLTLDEQFRLLPHPMVFFCVIVFNIYFKNLLYFLAFNKLSVFAVCFCVFFINQNIRVVKWRNEVIA